MKYEKLHADELLIKYMVVVELLTSQMPELASLPMRTMDFRGTDNVIIRLGEELAMRLPRTERAAALLWKEQQYLPLLAPHVSMRLPCPLDSVVLPHAIHGTGPFVAGLQVAIQSLGNAICSWRGISLNSLEPFILSIPMALNPKVPSAPIAPTQYSCAIQLHDSLLLRATDLWIESNYS